MAERRMFRYEVPIDDQAHTFELTDYPVAVAANLWHVEFWAMHTDGAAVASRTLQVFGTGHLVPDGAVWVATCPRTMDGLVWHLFELGVTR